MPKLDGGKFEACLSALSGLPVQLFWVLQYSWFRFAGTAFLGSPVQLSGLTV